MTRPLKNRRRLASDESIAKVREWWEFRKIGNIQMCRKLGISRGTLLQIIRKEGAYARNDFSWSEREVDAPAPRTVSSSDATTRRTRAI